MILAAAINLSAAWATMWSKVNTGNFADLLNLLTIGGVAVVLGAILKFIWDKRRNQGQATPVWWAIVVGILLAGPGAAIPVLLKIADIVANAFLNLFS